MNRKIETAIVVAPRIWKSSKNYHNSVEEISLLVSTLGVKVKGNNSGDRFGAPNSWNCISVPRPALK